MEWNRVVPCGNNRRLVDRFPAGQGVRARIIAREGRKTGIAGERANASCRFAGNPDAVIRSAARDLKRRELHTVKKVGRAIG